MRDPDPPPMSPDADLPPRFQGGDDDPAEGNWHPPLEKDPPMPQRIAREFAETPPDETGTQAFWRQTLRHEPMPSTGLKPPTKDTDRPPPYAPLTEPLGYGTDRPVTMPNMDIHIHELPTSPGVPGTLDEPPGEKHAPVQDPDEILYTGRHLGGHLGAVNA